MKRVLIVDDAIELGRTLKEALKLMHPDIPVIVVPSAEEALLEVTRYVIDLLVTDLRLPGMTGYDLIRKIRIRQPNVKVILITGLSPDDPMLRQKTDAVPDVFMRKPISSNAFLDEVDRLIFEPKQPETIAGPQVEVATPKSEKEAAKQALLDELAGVLPGVPADPRPQPKKQTGRLGITAPLQPKGTEESLSASLSRLRSSLGLVSAMLLDDSGHPVAQAGDLPDMALEDQLIAPIMTSLSSGARISYLLGLADAQSVQAYRGVSMDLVVAPVGQYALLIAIKVSRSAVRLAIAFEEALNAQTELISALETMGLHVRSTFEASVPDSMLSALSETGEPVEEVIPPEILETPLGQDLYLEKFEELFSKKKTGQLKWVDADSFWDTAAKKEGPDITNPGMLNWEQAQKLGLLPSEKGE